MEQDLVLLDKILKDMNYTTEYRNNLISDLVKNLEDYGLKNITRNFLYVSLTPEEGKEKAAEIADYWDQMKTSGSYKTKLQSALEKSPIFSKYMK